MELHLACLSYVAVCSLLNHRAGSLLNIVAFDYNLYFYEVNMDIFIIKNNALDLQKCYIS
jgi:hypothetical protein